MRLQGFVRNTTRYTEAHNRDCTVRALSAVCNLPYNLVREALKLSGRRSDAAGFDILTFLRQYKYEVFGKSFTLVRDVSLTGVYFCGNNGHVWAVIDGKLYDNVAGNRRMKYVYRVLSNPDGDETEALLKRAKLLADMYDAD